MTHDRANLARPPHQTALLPDPTVLPSRRGTPEYAHPCITRNSGAISLTTSDLGALFAECDGGQGLRLPDEFQRQLHDAAGTRSSDAAESRRRKVGHRIVEVHLIECVEELAAHLQAHISPHVHI